MARAAAIVLVVSGIGVSVAIALGGREWIAEPSCGAGFMRAGARCMVPAASCPAPLQMSAIGCDAPDLRILVPAATVVLGSADWELEGRLPARAIHVPAFRIDAFEVTKRRWDPTDTTDPLRAATGMTRGEAVTFCQSRGGRLPTEDEWMAAAVAGAANADRYPWGDTGAVCRRAAWGLGAGPCGSNANGPDTVGAHRDGDSALGLHDLAGNVAEWVAADPTAPEGGLAKGGSWRSALAGQLRIWSRLAISPSARDSEVGLRCVYAP